MRCEEISGVRNGGDAPGKGTFILRTERKEEMIAFLH